MKRKWIYTLGIIALFYFNGGVEAQNPEITSKELKQHVNYLAADELEGRKAGTSGGEKAAEYIRGQFKNYGLDLMAENGFQHFELINSAEAGKNNLLKIDGEKATPKKDFVPISFSANKSLTADVVFAGYGFQFDKDTLQWNDYKGIDAKGKWVMMFRGDPQPDNPHSPYAMQAMPRSKIVTAEDNNAGGVLFVTPVGMNEKDQLPRIFYDKTATKADIPVLTITRALADKILSGTNKSISGLENKLTETHSPQSFAIPTRLKGRADVNLERATTQNVVARLAAPGSDEYVVVGAHYDHLGMGGPGSGSRNPDTSAVHNGADDNASGVAGLIELAGKLQHERAALDRNIVFVAFGAEEMGLIGSKHFVTNAPFPVENITAMMNFDMLGRLDKDDKKLSIGGVGTAKEFKELLNENLADADFSLSTSQDGYGPSDHA
ncbi:MAG: M20/M25/M40 family metallo-hydrolase, partial [Bacteroidales bacterium]|nr:M20/M25/M40 family metallo-hydrolase [Bacteroidales bacterium]